MAILVLLEENNNLFTYKALRITYVHPKSKCANFKNKTMHTIVLFLTYQVSLGPKALRSYGSPILRLNVSTLMR